jgi:biopolymer transport protein ExbB/TolQ
VSTGLGLRALVNERFVVTPNSRNRFLSSVFSSMGWPLLTGIALWMTLYALIREGVIQHDLVTRYLANHPVEYIEMLLFFVGVSALMIKAVGVIAQFRGNGKVQLAPAPASGQKIDDTSGLIDSLLELPKKSHNTYLVRRLRDALGYVRAKQSAEDLDDQLKYLADMDAERRHDSYALVRLVVWAIPILGFLGTVIGVTMAIGTLSPEVLAGSSKEGMGDLTDGLAVAFDTTTVALSLSIVLMFAQFLVNKLETQLLETVDERAADELTGRFVQFGTKNDPLVASVERMSARVAASTDTLVREQAKIWESTLAAAHQRWSQLTDTSGKTLEQSLTNALRQSLTTHAAELQKSEEAAAQRNGLYVEQLRSALVQSAQVMKDQQAELVKQGQVMSRALEATGDIIKLEKALNENLSALSGAKNFEDTVMSLSAAIHLLNSRLGHAGPATTVALEPANPSSLQERAA